MKGQDHAGPSQDVPSHQDVVARGNKLLHKVAGHKQKAIKAARKLHEEGQYVHLELDEANFEDKRHARLHGKFKSAATQVNELLPSVMTVHDQLHEHVKKLREGGIQNAQERAKAESLQAGLGHAKTWATEHGEDKFADILDAERSKLDHLDRFRKHISNIHPDRSRKVISKQVILERARMRQAKESANDPAKQEQIKALQKVQKEVQAELKKNPKASFLDGAKQKLTSLFQGGSSQQAY